MNPLDCLSDAKLFSLFERILAHRYRTDILRSYYKLPNISDSFTWFSGQRRFTPREKAQFELQFLKQKNEIVRDSRVAAQHFWREVSPRNPDTKEPLHGNHLHEHLKNEDAYNRIGIEASDLKLIQALFPLFKGWLSLDILDVGGGPGTLGLGILKYFRKQKGHASYFNWLTTNITTADVYDPKTKGYKNNQHATYIIQPSPTNLPIPPNSKDLVITKWCFHHMSHDEMRVQIRNIFEILRPGGMAVVIEAFSTKQPALPPNSIDSSVPELSFMQRLNEVSHRVEFLDLWPDGDWKDDCYKISCDYLQLSWQDQHALLSLEDFFGHYVLNWRHTMQFPFSYLPAESIIDEFQAASFIEDRWNFLLFGLAPIIRRGPPTARFVFRKPM